MGSPQEILKKFWNYDSFRPGQLEIISEALEGRDVLGILPTGGGKSITFQVSAMASEGLALVVTPLIALMKDQVESLERKGIRALALHSGMSRHEVDTALNNAVYGDFKFLYLSPERLSTELFQRYLNALNVNYIVVDEAHCISQWGYDFRPDYLQVAKIRKSLSCPVIALTATATPQVADDIMDKLEFTSPNVIKTSFERPNLTYMCRECQDKRGEILRWCNSHPGTGIIYARSRALTEELSALLRCAGVSTSFYHAGLSPQERSKRQKDWLEGRTRVMVCTNAFGMGIDKPDVRFVLHYGMPDSIESYFQEAGRAGRDLGKSTALLLWNNDDCRRLRQQHSSAFPPLEYMEDIYHKVHAFYGIAYERGEGKQLRLDLKAFCQQYSLNQLQAWNAMKYLDRCGHWTLMEDVEVATKVMISVDRTALYGIDLPEKEMDAVLEALMRRYEGLFSFPVVIDEEYVARHSAVSVSMLRRLLYNMSLMHIIRYIPGTVANIIWLHTNRLHPKDVNLKPQLYNMLMDTSGKRLEAMIDYASDNSRCRSTRLLEYFGQKDALACGKCDVCRGEDSAKNRFREQMDEGMCNPYEI